MYWKMLDPLYALVKQSENEQPSSPSSIQPPLHTHTPSPHPSILPFYPFSIPPSFPAHTYCTLAHTAPPLPLPLSD